MKINYELKSYVVEFSYYIIDHRITSIKQQFVSIEFQSYVLIRLKKNTSTMNTPSNHNYHSTL